MTITHRLAILVVVVASVKFIFDGVSIKVFGNSFDFGHVEPLVYGTFLGPVLGAHGWIEGKKA